jgi:cation/acetate symporter
MLAARYASLGVSIFSILLALFAQNMNVAFLVSLAFCVAASANLPVILYTIYWKRFNTSGAVTAMVLGLVSALILVAISPNVFSPIEGAALFVGEPIFSLTNPAIISVPLGFLGGYLGTVLSKEVDLQRYAEVQVKANTGYRE